MWSTNGTENLYFSITNQSTSESETIRFSYKRDVLSNEFSDPPDQKYNNMKYQNREEGNIYNNWIAHFE